MSPIAESQPFGQMVPLTALFPSPLNPRKKFTAESLHELESNIQRKGEVITPLIVRTSGAQFEIIDGERRYRASTRAGNIEVVPAIVRDDLTDSDAIEMMLLTSIQRQQLTPMEEAGGYKALLESNRSKYSVAYIADQIGRSEKYVWDRMKLLDLEPIVAQLLDAELILVSHAEVLAKLKPEDQLAAVGHSDYGEWTGGLFERAASRLGFGEPGDDEDDEDDDESLDDPVAIFRALKARTVKELEAWISRHVRFDVEHAAVAAPLDFGQAAEQVAAAESKPGRGKKVVEITYEYQVPPAVRGETRMLTVRSWKRADGSDAAHPTCESSVLGVIAAGRGYGRTFEVCIAKDRCHIHWKAEIKEREKNQKLRQQGKGGQAAQNEAVSQAAAREREAAERLADEARQQAWHRLAPHLEAEVIAQLKKVKTLSASHGKALQRFDPWGFASVVTRHLGATWWKSPAAALLITFVAGATEQHDTFDDYIKSVAKPLGLNITRLEAIRDKHAPVEPPKPSGRKPAKATRKAKVAKPAKTARKGKKR